MYDFVFVKNKVISQQNFPAKGSPSKRGDPKAEQARFSPYLV
jgi:hypothetical protein